jgi:hypothetical protein
MEMNEYRPRVSGWVQRRRPKVIVLIGEPRPSDRRSQRSLEEETTMLKTISAALLAVSVMAAPAFAGTYGKTTDAPVIKSELAKSKVLNANARMGRHHHRHHHRYIRHHRHHKHIGVIKTHVTPKVAVKHVILPAKRG